MWVANILFTKKLINRNGAAFFFRYIGNNRGSTLGTEKDKMYEEASPSFLDVAGFLRRLVASGSYSFSNLTYQKFIEALLENDFPIGSTI